jgi:hypothetical protein
VKRETEGSDLCSPQARRQGKKKGGKSPFFLKNSGMFAHSGWREKNSPHFFYYSERKKKAKVI